jgi:hypothetical protein
LTELERTHANDLLEKTRQLWDYFFTMHKLLKVTNQFDDIDVNTLQCNISQVCTLFRAYIPGPVPPKVHILEAHVVPFIQTYGCSWAYSEEGIESAHHWIKFFSDKTGHVAGQKRKLERFGAKWLEQQHPSTRKHYRKILEEGKQRVHKRKKLCRKKKAPRGASCSILKFERNFAFHFPISVN